MGRPKKTETTPVKEKKPKTPRKPRDLEKLMELAPETLTPAEKITLIVFLKEQINLLCNKIDALNTSVDSSFKQARELEKKYESMEAFYRQSLQYVDDQVNAFHSAVSQATRNKGVN